MNKTRSKVIALMLVLTLVLASAATAVAAEVPGIQVQYNGTNIAFTDVAPRIADGRTMVPFRQVLEAMGAEVSYDAATKIITAKSADRTVSFKAGSTAIDITQNGQTTRITSDVAPFIDQASGRTLVPVRFMAEALGNTVGWDASRKTAIIMDLQAIFADADKDFSVLGLLLTSSLDVNKAYETTGSFAASFTAADPTAATAPALEMSMTGSMTGVQKKADADMTVNYNLDMSKMLAAMSAEERAEMAPMLDALKNVSLKIKLNGTSGDMHMSSGLFTTLDPAYTADTWLKMNLYDTYDALGVDLKGLMTQDYGKVSISDVLLSSLAMMDDLDVSSYQEIKAGYALLKNLVGDQAFRTRTSGATTTYTLSLDQTSVLAAIAKTALETGVPSGAADANDVAAFLKDTNLKADLTIQARDKVLQSYDVKASADTTDGSFAVGVSGDAYNTKLNLTLDIPQLMKMTMNMDSKIAETTKTPDLTLPAGAKVVDLGESMMGDILK